MFHSGLGTRREPRCGGGGCGVQGCGDLVVVTDVEDPVGVDAGVVDVGPLRQGVSKVTVLRPPDASAPVGVSPQPGGEEQAQLVGNLLAGLCRLDASALSAEGLGFQAGQREEAQAFPKADAQASKALADASS